METDADRLAMIKSLGGQLVRHPSGEFWALFDNEYYESDFGPGVEGRQPVLTARTIDVQGLAKDVPIDVNGVTYLFKRHEPDGTGMSRVPLKE